jgi:outer membrane protein
MLRFRVLSAFAMFAAALASTSVAMAQSKVGVVNFQKAISDSAELKKASNDLIAKFKPKQDELDKLNKDLADDTTQLQSSQGKLSPQREADLSARIQHEQRLSERMTQDLQDEVQAERDATIQRLGSRMTEIVKKLMSDKGLDMVLDTAAVISFKDAVDITVEATAAYDKAYPVKP